MNLYVCGKELQRNQVLGNIFASFSMNGLFFFNERHAIMSFQKVLVSLLCVYI